MDLCSAGDGSFDSRQVRDVHKGGLDAALQWQEGLQQRKGPSCRRHSLAFASASSLTAVLILTAGCNHCREASQGSVHTIHSARCDDVVPRVAQLHNCGGDGSHAYTPNIDYSALHAVCALELIAHSS